MDINNMIQEVKECPEYHSMGMIATHLGVVRQTSLQGKQVSEVEVRFEKAILNAIINDIEAMEGIFKVLIKVSDGTLKVGDDIMAVVVGGDIREHVFPALINAVRRAKEEAVFKREIYE